MRKGIGLLAGAIIYALVTVAMTPAGAVFASEAKGSDAKTEEKAPTVQDQIHALEAMCEASAEARAKRHEETSLYDRLGKDEGMHAFTKELVRLHLQNPAIKHMFEGLDNDKVAAHVAQFMISGLGGPAVYEGPSLTESHKNMNLTNADFLAAGGDVVQAMKNLGYGQNEIDEVICTLVALRPQVVLEDEQEKAAIPD